MGRMKYRREVYQLKSGAWVIDLPAQCSTDDLPNHIFPNQNQVTVIGDIHEDLLNGKED